MPTNAHEPAAWARLLCDAALAARVKATSTGYAFRVVPVDPGEVPPHGAVWPGAPLFRPVSMTHGGATDSVMIVKPGHPGDELRGMCLEAAVGLPEGRARSEARAAIESDPRFLGTPRQDELGFE